jgi:hypothetical protein
MPIIWTAGYDIPDYPPAGTDVVAFENRIQAVIFTVEALRGVAYDRSTSEPPNHAFAAEYERAADSLENQDEGCDSDWSETFEGGRVTFWLHGNDMAPDEAAEALKESAEALEREW